uniref:Aspartoacylase n=1 Tax=Chelonoidis abingdonii TaxID=106734 RepID=A0A8C0H8A8_CHEAB
MGTVSLPGLVQVIVALVSDKREGCVCGLTGSGEFSGGLATFPNFLGLFRDLSCRGETGMHCSRARKVGREAEDEPYEVVLAREINQTYGPKGSAQAFDFMFDLHNTTANMCTCLIVDSGEPAAMHVRHYIQMHYTQSPCPIYLYMLPGEEIYSINSVAKVGIELELGQQPHQVVRSDLFTQMRDLIACALDFIELFKKGTAFPAFEIEVYKITGRMDYPCYPNGEISAMVHPKLQDKDFLPLNPRDPIFQTFSGEEILY